jgi:integrase/recombinase XerD
MTAFQSSKYARASFSEIPLPSSDKSREVFVVDPPKRQLQLVQQQSAVEAITPHESSFHHTPGHIDCPACKVYGLMQLLAENQHLLQTKPKRLSELIELYFVKLEAKHNGEDTMAKNRRELNRFIDFAAQHSKFFAQEIDEMFLIRYVNTWKQLYPAPSTRNLVRMRLTQFLLFCVRLKELHVVPDIPRARGTREPTLSLTDEEFARLIVVASEARRRVIVSVPREVRRAVVLLMRWSGAAITDATMMQRESIFWDAEKNIYRCKFRRQKTGTLVNNPLSTEVAEEILQASKLCSSPTHLFQKDGEEGQGPGCKRRWTDWFGKAFKRAGMPSGHSHQLRDTFAVGLLLKRVPLESVSKALGHTSIKTTERYYSPWIKERQDQLDSLILNAVDPNAAVAAGAR